MSVSEPGKIITPWAELGLKNPIPPAANPATGRAGFDQGFSAINMTAKEAGGISPFGQDFNGIFYEVTNILRYMQAGGQPTFGSALATAIGGYPKGSVLLGSDGVTLWQSSVNSNFTDPNSDPSSWSVVNKDISTEVGAGLVGLSYSPSYLNGTVGARLRYIVCANDDPFNADPTNTTDSTAGILAAIQWAVDNGASVVWLRTGRYKVSGTITVPEGITLFGDGIDYWDTYRPAPDRLLKSWDKGTHLVFTGTGARDKTCINLANARPVKTVSGVQYPFTQFTQENSAGGNPATAKPFSVGVIVQRAAQLRNLRVMLNNDGIDGYNDAVSLSLGDDWDIGVWVYDASDAICENIQSVGYWRMGGWMLTENDGTYTQVGNPERIRFSKCLGQGRRGLIARNSPQLDVVSNTANTITLKYFPSFTLTAQNKFRVLGSATIYSFTGHSVAGVEITLTGVSPALPGGVTAVRAPNTGNNFSGTVFVDSVFTSLDHTSGTKSADLGLGEAGAFEIDGFPMRNLKFINTKFQTTFDRLNGIYGDCRDTKLVACEHENGALIAYNIAETIGFTENLRMVNTEISGTVDRTAFTPREMYSDWEQFPTQFTDGSFRMRPWSATNVSVEFFNGTKALELTESSGDVSHRNKAGQRYLRNNGVTGETVLSGENLTIQNFLNEPIVKLFSTSKNASFYGNASPAVANTGSVGTVSIPWAGGATQTAFTVTSDARSKTDPVEIGVGLAEAVMAIVLCQYKLLDRVDKKGDGARWHHGAIAQQVLEAFTSRGLDPHDYAFFCFDKWDGTPAIFYDHPAEYDMHGMLTREAWREKIQDELPAGESYSLRYEELLVVLMEALKRKSEAMAVEICSIKERISTAGM